MDNSQKTVSRKSFLAILGFCFSALVSGIWFLKFRQKISGKILGPNREVGHRIRNNIESNVTSNINLPISEKIKTLILGGGISGLSAGYYLHKFGFDEFKILELENDSGGNSRFGRNSIGAYPWGAHYLPQPGEEAILVRKFLEENEIIVGRDKNGNRFTTKNIFVSIPKKESSIKEDGTKVYIPQAAPGLGPRTKSKNLRSSFKIGDQRLEETVKKLFRFRSISPPEILNF